MKDEDVVNQILIQVKNSGYKPNIISILTDEITGIFDLNNEDDKKKLKKYFNIVEYEHKE